MKIKKTTIFVIVVLMLLSGILWLTRHQSRTALSVKEAVVDMPAEGISVSIENWKPYAVDGVTLLYPAELRIVPDIKQSILDEHHSVGFSNFTFSSSYEAFAHPYINYFSDQQVLFQIAWPTKNVPGSLEDWVAENVNNQNSDFTETVRVVNEDSSLSGTLVSEEKILIGGVPALQRVLSYQGKKGTIHLTYTYVKYKDRAYQVLLYSDSPRAQEIYKAFLTTIRFKEES